MNRRAALLIIVAILWSSLALGLSHALSAWPRWKGQGSTRASSFAKFATMPTPAPGGGVQAQVWRTAGEGWTQGQFEGTTALGEGAGIRLVSGRSQGSYISPAWTAPFAINALTWEWQGTWPQGAQVTIQAHVSANGQDWSPWQEIQLSHDELDSKGPWVGELIGVPSGGHVQCRLQLQCSPTGASPVIEVLAVTVLNSLRGPEIKSAKSMLLAPEEDGGVPRPPIISRAGWGADESLTNWEPEYRQPEKVIIHHTVTYNPDPLATLRAIHYYHAVTRKWGDIGYNYLIDSQGNIYEGRKGGEGVVAGHARGRNEGSIGIALLGDFTEQRMLPAMEEALIEMLAWIADRYGIAPQGRSPAWGLQLPNVLGHRDVGNTSCPGEQVYRRLPYVCAMASQCLLAYPPAVTVQAPHPGGPVGGKTRVEASSSSPLLAEMEFYVDGQLAYSTEGSPLVWEWDTSGYSDGEHLLKVVARGHQELNGELVQMVVVDNSPPRGSIVINGGGSYTRDPVVTLALAAADAGAGVEDVALAENGQWQARERFESRRRWNLSPGDGVKNISVRFWDGVGNPSPVYTGTIILDTTPPTWDRS